MPANPENPLDPDVAKIPGFDSLPSEDTETASALDLAAAAAEEVPAVETPEANAADPVETPADAPAATPAAVPVETPKDDFDAIQLPTFTKPKTGESFEAVKALARTKLLAADARVRELEAAAKDLTEKATAKPLTKEVETELEELRGFRRRLDVESDPEFKKFDTRVQEATESIYTQLLGSGATKETIDKIKALGGPSQVEWEPLLAKLPPTVRRRVETKLVETEELAEQKQRAIETAKKNTDAFLATRANQSEDQKKERHERAVQTLGTLRPQFDWLKPRAADAKATDSEKASAEAHNALVKESEDYLKEAMSDDSPEMRATIAMAGPELFRARAELKAVKATTDAQIKKLSDELKSTNDLLAKVKKGSTTRLRDSSAEGKPAKSAGINESPEEAIDRLAAEAGNATD